jgi:hypothetical protein
LDTVAEVLDERISDAAVAHLIDLLGEELFVEVLTVIGYFLMISDLAKVLEPATRPANPPPRCHGR